MESYYLKTGRLRFHKGLGESSTHVYLMLKGQRRKFTILRVHSSTMVQKLKQNNKNSEYIYLSSHSDR